MKKVHLVALSALAFGAPALAQTYPSKPLRLVTGFAAGSTGDVIARVTASGMSTLMGQPIVVENRAGGGGMVSAELVARAAPDGYTLLLIASGVQVMRGFMSRSAGGFDPSKELTPITRVGESTTCFVVNPSVPANSLKELLEYAKRNPGKLAYGSSGVGNQTHMAGELIKVIAGVDILHVPYKAAASALQDVMSGQLPTSFALLGLVMPAHKAGKIRVLAVVRDDRHKNLPDVPTVTEVLPDFERPPTWTGLSGPAGMPQPVLRRVHADAVKALNEPAAKARLEEGAGLEVMTNASPEEFSALIRKQIDYVARIVKTTGVQPE
jgi:tripartite-type tricarboxylate transporter receptor subunit TctC